MKALNEKYLLKKAAQGFVPPAVLTRHKQPYRAPDGVSFFGDKPPEYVQTLLSEGRLKADGLFEPSTVKKLVEKFKQGRAIGVKDNMALVGILSTQIVNDLFIRRHHTGNDHVR
jgi:asparagine synthase (glutamine-hydrolysing)